MAGTMDDLREFSEFVAEKVRSSVGLSPEAALDEWRSLRGNSEDLAAVEEALDDRANGDVGRPFDEVLAELRQQYGLSGQS
ncbi:MAG: hypothetical protein ACRC8S_02190 [Fimbriiglobus sp.]